jgi:hypothetical protein
MLGKKPTLGSIGSIFPELWELRGELGVQYPTGS